MTNISSLSEFERLMKEVDAELRADGIPIAHRSMRGLGLVARRLNVDIKGGPLRTGPIQGCYVGDSLSAHIYAWFDRMYGDRDKINIAIGKVLCMIDDDPWVINIPRIFGSVRLVCHPDLSVKFPNCSRRDEAGEFQPPMLNVLEQIEGMPQSRMDEFGMPKMKALMDFFREALHAHYVLEEIAANNPMAREVIHDLSASALFSCSSSTNYPQSKWASLQAAEKGMKVFISEMGQTFKRGHVLSKVYASAEKLGLKGISENDLSEIQCEADVRYGGIPVDFKESVRAHLAAFQVVSTVAKTLFPLPEE